MLEDCSSTNGVYLNGVRIFGSALLRAGDSILIGATSALGVLRRSRSPSKKEGRAKVRRGGDSNAGRVASCFIT